MLQQQRALPAMPLRPPQMTAAQECDCQPAHLALLLRHLLLLQLLQLRC
jgi:hypothetical protein